MSEPKNRFEITRADLHRRCPLLDEIKITDWGILGIVRGVTMVRKRAKSVTPRAVTSFRDEYQRAVAAGIIKPQTEQEPAP